MILDMTHGGAILAERFLDRGDDVTCVDVYRIASDEVKTDLETAGARVDVAVPQESYDLLVSPMHCPDSFLGSATYSEWMSFSRAVNLFVKDGIFRIEVTGVKGKTSTCYMLAHILDIAGRKVFLHSSRGQGPWIEGRHRIDALKSIAPTSILELPAEGYDCIISEVSLGGSGKADIAAITNLTEDYGIARNTRKASQAKAEIFTDGVNIVRSDEVGVWKSLGHRDFIVYGNNVEPENVPAVGKGVDVSYRYGGRTEHLTLDPGYLSLQYLPSMDLVLEICERMGIPSGAVRNGLSSFRGVPGRGEISKDGDVLHVLDRNPGISHISMDMTLSCLKRMGSLEGAVVVVDPVSKKVCDKMDTDQMAEIASRYGVPIQFTDGSGFRPVIPEGTRTVIEFVKEGFQ